MSGYYGNSKSNNAIEAEKFGYFSKSNFDMDFNFFEILKDEFDLQNKTVELLKSFIKKNKISKKNILAKYADYKEWHHTGKCYNKTDYYFCDFSNFDKFTDFIKDLRIFVLWLKDEKKANRQNKSNEKKELNDFLIVYAKKRNIKSGRYWNTFYEYNFDFAKQVENVKKYNNFYYCCKIIDDKNKLYKKIKNLIEKLQIKKDEIVKSEQERKEELNTKRKKLYAQIKKQNIDMQKIKYINFYKEYFESLSRQNKKLVIEYSKTNFTDNTKNIIIELIKKELKKYNLDKMQFCYIRDLILNKIGYEIK